MKQIAIYQKYIIFYIVLFMLNSHVLEQCLKIPFFISHYIEHQENNNSINIFQYIQLHYFSGNIQDDDYQQDQKLPFKSEQTCNHTSLGQVLYNKVEKINIQVIDYIENTSVFNPLQKHFVVQTILKNIWQPPKLV